MGATVIGRRVGGMIAVHGTWTHEIGAAAPTVTVGGRVLAAFFQDCDADQMKAVSIPYSLSMDTSTGITTITWYPSAAVTTGRFVIIC